MTNKEIKDDIIETFERLEVLRNYDSNSSASQHSLTGQIQLSYDFENIQSHDDVLQMVEEEGYCRCNHNFEIAEGLNVMILMQ